MFYHYANWNEIFKSPRGEYSGFPGFVEWPGNTSKGSFYSYRSVIYRTTDFTNGIGLLIDARDDAYYDAIHMPWYGACMYYEETRYHYYTSMRWSGLGDDRQIWFSYNYPPTKPDKPTATANIGVNEPSTITVMGEDPDGDSLTYQFDFGDGTLSEFGANTVEHAWSQPGTYGIRARSQDSPYETMSAWSDTFFINVNGLSRIEIQGPDKVNEKSGAQFVCIAYFTDNSSESCLPSSTTWSLDASNLPYAGISNTGYLTTYDGNGQDRLLTISATYINQAITKTDLHWAWLIDTDLDNDCLPNGVDPNPYDADSDDDGIPDGTCSPGEDLNNNGILDPGETDPANPDTDGDGIMDGTETGLTAPILPAHTDMTVFIPDADPTTQTDPTNPDSDNDGLQDGQEDSNFNGSTELGESDPTNADSDSDGISDGGDANPISNVEPTVVIGQDTGVANILLENGETINDRIAQCGFDAHNHGDFTSCVAQLGAHLVHDGILSGKDKGILDKYAAKAKIP